jgi:hypothetical protein
VLLMIMQGSLVADGAKTCRNVREVPAPVNAWRVW